MKFTIDRASLIRMLRNVRQAVPRDSDHATEPWHLQCRVDLAERIMSITGTDGRRYIQDAAYVDADDVSFTVDAKAFASAVKNTLAETVTVTVDETELTLAGGRSRWRMPVAVPREDSAIPVPEGERVTLPGEFVRRALRLGQPFMSTDETRPSICGVVLICDGETLVAAATDGHRLMELSTAADGLPVFSIIIPDNVVTAVAGSTSDAISIHHGDAIHRIQAGFLSVAHRRVVGQFPSMRTVFPMYFTADATLDSRELKAALTRAMRFQTNRYDAAQFVCGGGLLSVVVSEADGCVMMQDVPALGWHEHFEVLLVPHFVAAIVGAIAPAPVTVQYAGAGQPLVFTPEGRAGERYALMPSKLKESK